MTNTVTLLLSLGTIFAHIISLIIIASLIFKGEWAEKVKGLVGEYALWFALIPVLSATLGSLYYSNIALMEPCLLCWYQRIFMYPQVFLLILGIVWKDKNILRYTMLLSVVGLMLAGYQYFMQIGVTAPTACGIGPDVSCSDTYIQHFGYITIPLMSATVFLLSLLASLVYEAKR